MGNILEICQELDSKSSEGNLVWVQVPPSVLCKALSDKDFRQRLHCLLWQ